MAYFSNGTEGEVFDAQCSICKYGESACPIATVQLAYNYDACNIPVARKILDSLVSDDGACAMFLRYKSDFKVDAHQQKLEL